MRWVLGGRAKILFSLVSIFFLGRTPVLFSMYQRSPYSSSYYNSSDREWRRIIAMKERIALMQELRKELDQKRQELAALREGERSVQAQAIPQVLMSSPNVLDRVVSWTKSWGATNLEADTMNSQELIPHENAQRVEAIARLEAEIRDIEDALNKYRESAKNDPYGKLVALALAGEDCEMLGETPINNVLDGFAKGITVRATRALGDVVNKKVGILVNDTLGATWDSMYKTFKIGAGKVWSLLFHHSHEPFTASELDSWSELILSCLDDFAKLVKGRMEVESRAHDMTSRSFDNNEDQNVINQDQLVWESIVSGYTEQIDYFVAAIDRRIHYYKDEAIEAFYGRQLCNRLLAFKNIILSTRSLKDLSAKLGSNATLLVAMNNNIKKLFKKLSDEVRPAADNGNQNAKSNQMSNDYYSQRRRYPDRDDTYPSSFDDNFGGYGGL